MDDATLAKASLIVALAGIAGIAAVSYTLEPESTFIADIDGADSGKIMKVTGSLSGLSQRDGNYFLTIDDGSEIDAVIFESDARKMGGLAGLKKGASVEATGRVAVYRGELEIIVQALNVLSN